MRVFSSIGSLPKGVCDAELLNVAMVSVACARCQNVVFPKPIRVGGVATSAASIGIKKPRQGAPVGAEDNTSRGSFQVFPDRFSDLAGSYLMSQL